MKHNKNILTAACLCAAALLIIIINMFIQLNVIENYPLDETIGSAVKNIILRGNLLHCILVTGIALYLLVSIQAAAKKKNQLEEMINKLIQKDFSSIEDISGDQKTADLQKGMNDLSSWIKKLQDAALSAGQMKNAYSLILEERNRELENLRASLHEMMQNISDLEEQFSDASEKIILIRKNSPSYQEQIDEQSDFINNAGQVISESALLTNNLSKKMSESIAFSKALEQEIAAGEDAALEVSGMIKSVSSDLEKIHEVTLTINKISEQTNILSMNAAIESAHAGEAGAGFAVVADEIRKLAESTRENSDQISGEVNALMDKIKAALHVSKNSSASFSGVSEKIRGFSNEIVSIDAAASQSLEKTEESRNALRKTAELSQFVKENNIEIEAEYQHIENSINSMKDILEKTKNVVFVMQTKSNEHFSGKKSIELQSAEKTDPLKKEIFTLKSSSEIEKHEIEEMRKTIATVELPQHTAAGQASLKASASISVLHDKELYYDERGVAVKRPPITIYSC